MPSRGWDVQAPVGVRAVPPARLVPQPPGGTVDGGCPSLGDGSLWDGTLPLAVPRGTPTPGPPCRPTLQVMDVARVHVQAAAEVHVRAVAHSHVEQVVGMLGGWTLLGG